MTDQSHATGASPIFLVGAQRSGTTALAAALQQAIGDAGGCFTTNGRLPHLLRRWLTQTDVDGHQFRADEVSAAIASYKPTAANDAWKARATKAAHDAAQRIALGIAGDHLCEARRICCETYATHQQALWGDKYNEYLLDLEYLHSLFPAARWIYVARHPSEVVQSAVRWHKRAPWHVAEPQALCDKWIAWNSRWLDFRSQLRPTRRVEISYEQLCAGRFEEIETLIGLNLTPYLQNYKPQPKPSATSTARAVPPAAATTLREFSNIGLQLNLIDVPANDAQPSAAVRPPDDHRPTPEETTMTDEERTLIIREIARLKNEPENTLSATTPLWSDADTDAATTDSAVDFDSLDLLNFLVWLEDTLAVELPEEEIDLGAWQTIGDLFDAIDRARTTDLRQPVAAGAAQ